MLKTKQETTARKWIVANCYLRVALFSGSSRYNLVMRLDDHLMVIFTGTNFCKTDQTWVSKIFVVSIFMVSV